MADDNQSLPVVEPSERFNSLELSPSSDNTNSKPRAWNGDGSRDSMIASSKIERPLSGLLQSSTGSVVDERMLSEKASTSDSVTLASVVENLILSSEDETRVEVALISADKKQVTGSVFSLRVDVGSSGIGVLGIGVKDLHGGVLVVSMLKRKDGKPGPAERAGIRLGDVIFGINFLPARQGAQSLIKVISGMNEQTVIAPESAALRSTAELRGNTETTDPKVNQPRSPWAARYIFIQCWRCHQLCPDTAPGFRFPRTDDVVVKAYALHRNKIVSDWERWNFLEILLSYMLTDAEERAGMTAEKGFTAADRKIGPQLSPVRHENLKQISVIDLEKNLMFAKCLRRALCVRIVHTKPTTQQDTVVYVLRVEDVETGLQWVAHRRYRDFFALNEELNEMSGYVRDVEFPQKRLVSKTSKVVESRVVLLEQYLRKVLHLLTLRAMTDFAASRSLRHVQKFLRVDKYIDCMYPPAVDDQRYIEFLAFQFLNDFGSPACQQCVRFVNNVDLESLVQHGQPEGYRPMLQHISQALMEVEQFTLQQHQQQMHSELRERRPEMSTDQITTFVRRCVRRQVEAALFLPLRRNILRLVFPFIAPLAQQMQEALKALYGAPAEYFLVNSVATNAPAMAKAIQKFREVTRAYLPADQSQLLMHAAAAVMEVVTDCLMQEQQQLQLRLQMQLKSRSRNLADLSSGNHKNVETKQISVSTNTTETCDPDSAEDDGERDGDGKDKTAPTGEWEREHGLDIFTGASRASEDSEYTESQPENGKAKPSRRWSVGASAVADKEIHKDLGSDKERRRALDFSVPIPPGSTPQKAQIDVPPLGPEHTAALGSDRTTRRSSMGAPLAARPATLPVSVPGRNANPAVVSAAGPSAESARQSASMSSKQRKPKEYDLQSAAALADPVSAIFESKETVPARFLLGDSSRARRLPGTGYDLSVLCASSDEEEEAEPLPVRDASRVPLSSPRPTTSSPRSPAIGDPNSLWISGSYRAGTFSPSIAATLTSSSPMSNDCSSTGEELLKPQLVQQRPGDRLRTRTASFLKVEVPEEQPSMAMNDGILGEDDRGSEATNTSSYYEFQSQTAAVSADDFLPMFTYVLVQANLPHLLVIKELMTSLVDDEETYGECGYYLATLEAALKHIGDLATDYKREKKL